MRVGRCLSLLAFAVSVPLSLLEACGDDAIRSTPTEDAAAPRVRATPQPGPSSAPGPGAPDASDASEASLPPPSDAASCNVLEEEPSVLPAQHVAVGLPLAYDSNPPSSGPHYPDWADFQEYDTPVPDGYLVHSLEHGAVLLLYRCEALDAAAGSCPQIVAALRSVRDGLEADPLCTPPHRVRVILAPRPTNDVPIAAAAWGYTYKASCFDSTSLMQWVRAHYAKSAENTCAPGITTFQ